MKNFVTKNIRIRLLLNSVIAVNACVKDHQPQPDASIGVPAGWEEQESVWTAWPTYDNKHDWSTKDAYAAIIKALATTAKVDIIVPDAATESEAAQFLMGTLDFAAAGKQNIDKTKVLQACLLQAS